MSFLFWETTEILTKSVLPYCNRSNTLSFPQAVCFSGYLLRSCYYILLKKKTQIILSCSGLVLKFSVYFFLITYVLNICWVTCVLYWLQGRRQQSLCGHFEFTYNLLFNHVHFISPWCFLFILYPCFTVDMSSWILLEFCKSFLLQVKNYFHLPNGCHIVICTS